LTIALLGALALLAGVILTHAAPSARLRLLPAWGAFLLLVALWTACGGGGLHVLSGGTPAGTYALTVTATSGGVSRSTTLILKVNCARAGTRKQHPGVPSGSAQEGVLRPRPVISVVAYNSLANPSMASGPAHRLGGLWWS